MKSTISLNKPFFEMSVQELLFALDAADAYQVFRVSAAFSAEATIACIGDLTSALEDGRGKLAVVMGGAVLPEGAAVPIA